MKIMTLNCGSSSVKYALWEMPGASRLCNGIVERIGVGCSTITHQRNGKEAIQEQHVCPTHNIAINLVFNLLTSPEHGPISDLSEIAAVAHRVVHGGEKYTKSVIIDRDVIEVIEANVSLAPLHNPPNLLGINAATQLMKDIPHIACWDTAFSAAFMPLQARIYAIPYEYYEKHGIRRYGYQGLSHLYVAKRAIALMNRPIEQVNLITLHIGNGSTVTAVKGGTAYDQSLGFSTCGEGLVMGTRCGDLDPIIPLFIMQKEGLTIPQIEDVLYRRSGVLGLSGKYIDRRDIINAAAKGDKRAELTLAVECYRLRKYIGSYAAAMGGVDAIVFTAGVGENSPIHRERSCEGLSFMGVEIDTEKNQSAVGRKAEMEISTMDSKVKVFVIPTDEELVMAEDTIAIIEDRYDVHTNFEYTFEKPDFVPTFCRSKL
jgi:acetate kinase